MSGGGSTNAPSSPLLQYWYIAIIGIVVLFIGIAIILSDHPEVIQTATKAAAAGE